MDVQTDIESELGSTVIRLTPRAGGDAAQAYTCELANGRRLFCKTVASGSPFAMEALGLQRLNVPGGVRVPEVLAHSSRFLALELLEFGPPSPHYQEELGRQLAETHRQNQRDTYGFDADHWIGATPQKNTPQLNAATASWPEFWWTHRLEPLFNRLASPESSTLAKKLEPRLPGLLGDSQEPPCLIHGDLWRGNVAADAMGAPVMFDPAPSYSHREAEFGMTKLFGGFTPRFYQAYSEAFPLEEGWRERQDIYMLYHVLNHAVLFGSGYLTQAKRIVNSYV